jgi:hypothetical protein
MEERNSVPIGLPVGQIETPSTHWQRFYIPHAYRIHMTKYRSSDSVLHYRYNGLCTISAAYLKWTF